MQKEVSFVKSQLEKLRAGETSSPEDESNSLFVKKIGEDDQAEDSDEKFCSTMEGFVAEGEAKLEEMGLANLGTHTWDPVCVSVCKMIRQEFLHDFGTRPMIL